MYNNYYLQVANNNIIIMYMTTDVQYILVHLYSVPARLGKGQGAKEIGHDLARKRPKFGHNLVRKRHKIGHTFTRE